MDRLIQIRDLSRIYRHGSKDVVALDRVSLTIEAGEFVALRGPSGSGKSTLLNIIAGIDRQTSGQCVVQGVDLSELDDTKLTRWRRVNAGFIFQTFNLIPVLTAFENVEMPLLLTDLKRSERAAHAQAALDLVGLADRMDHLPKELSGGQEQRVAIARAIALDPPLILADEPTGNLDGESAGEILELLARLNSEAGKSIVMVTHDAKAAEYARRTIHLEKGELKFETAVA